MIPLARTVASLSVLAASIACATARATSPTSASPPSPSVTFPDDNNASEPTAGVEGPCSDCTAARMPADMSRAIESRIANLKARGGDCSRYASVLETSYRGGQITIRPFMWRVGTHLASGEAKPNGDMMLAREIDSLNVGVRTVEDVVRTMEHEAAHIAFDFASGNDATEEKTNQAVRACSS